MKAHFDSWRPDPNRDHIYREPNVVEVTGLSRSTIWRRIRAGDFPPPIRLSPGTKGWKASDIQQWIAARTANR